VNVALHDPVPKAELHVHVEGTMEPEMVFDLAQRNGVQLPYADVEDLRTRYAFDDLQSFLDLYYSCMVVLVTRRDFADLAWAYLRRAHEQGVVHVELFFDPQAHTARGVPIDDVIDGLRDALLAAEQAFGISGGLILCFLRDQPVAKAMATLESVAHRAGDLIGVGLDSAEVGYPPGLFAPVFDRARLLGLRLVAHAGEEGPPEYIWEALRELRVERVDHGVRCLEDPVLVEHLRSTGMGLTVCPLSTVRLRGVAHLSEHPLPRMLAAGLAVSINSDDPAYFGGYADDAMRAVQDEFSFDDQTVAILAHSSISMSFATAERRREVMDEIENWVGRRAVPAYG
jgi:adenosine deaminase